MFSTAWTVVDAIRNLLPTVTAKHLPVDLLQLFQDGRDNGKWCAAADPFTVFSYPMVHLVNSPQPPRFLWCHEDILILIFWWLGCGCSFWCELKFFLPWGYCMCCEVISFAMRLFFLSLVFFFLLWVFFFLPWGQFFYLGSCGPPYVNFWHQQDYISLSHAILLSNFSHKSLYFSFYF